MSLLAAARADEMAATVFIDIAVILVVARLAGHAARRLRQPAVVGEIIGGLALGPSLLGALPGHLTTRLFPTDVRPYLQVVAQLGLIIFMFIIGLELDLGLIRGRSRTAAVISISSIAVPFVLGFPLAVFLHHNHGVVAGKEVDLFPFALFIGASMSVTAFPVLARILAERGMMRTSIGALTLACAAIDDVMAWSLLAVVLAVVASSSAWDLPRILLESVLFVGFMLVVVRPALARFIAGRRQQAQQVGAEVMAVVLVGVLVCSFVTAKIGIHQIFGAFLFGVVMPRDARGELGRRILERLETVSVLLLLPVFFVITGLGTNVRGIGRRGLGELGLILLVACAGKFIGATLAARSQGIRGRRAATIGTLMNTRGLTELVILNVGLAFGVLDTELFSMLVAMAIVTTVMAEPILRFVYPDRLVADDVAEAERAAVGDERAPRVLVSVGDAAHAERMVDLAIDLLAGELEAEVVITRFSPREARLEVGSGLVVERGTVTGWMGDLDDLARRVEARGIRSVVLYQLSDDVAGDLVSQAASVGARWLLIGAPREADAVGAAALDSFSAETGLVYRDFLHRVLAEAPCEVGTVVHPVQSNRMDEPAVLLVLGSGHDRAATDAAVQVAASTGLSLKVLGGGDGRPGTPAAPVLEQARKVGVAGAAVPTPDGVSYTLRQRPTGSDLVVVGVGDWRRTGQLGEMADRMVDAVDAMVLAVRSPAAPE